MLQATASASLLWSLVFVALVALSWLVPAAHEVTIPRIPPVTPQHRTITPRVIGSAPRVRNLRSRGMVVPVQEPPRPLPDEASVVAPSAEGAGSGENFSDPNDGAESRDDGAGEPPPPLRTEFRVYDQDPVAIIHDPPAYPDLARDAGVEGRVVIALLIDRSGHVRDAVVERSVLMLDASVVEATRRWVYQPALIDNRPVMAWVRVPFDFRLH